MLYPKIRMEFAGVWNVGINVWFWQAVYLELGVSAEPEKAVCKKSGYVCGA